MRGISTAACSAALALLAQQAHAYDSKWKRIEADNGAAFAIDLGSISHNTNGSAVAVICVVDNDTCIPPNISRLLFDCHGHYMDIDRGGSLTIAPPRSVVGQMAALACAGAKDTRFSTTPRAPKQCGVPYRQTIASTLPPTHASA